MHLHKDPPVDLREALSATPFLHLIPKQDLAPLLSSINIGPVDELEETIGLSAKSQAAKTRAAINSDPARFKAALNLLKEEFTNFDDPELDQIRFKRPLIAAHRSDTIEYVPELPPLENELYKSMENIEDSDLNEFSLQLNLPDLDEREIGLYANGREQQNELFNEGVLDCKKRSFHEKGPASIHQIKRQKYLEPEELVTHAFGQLKSLLSNLEVHENDIDKRYWAKKNEDTFLNNHTLMLILDHLQRLNKTPKFKEMGADNIICIQNLCLRSLERNSETDWTDIPASSERLVEIVSYFEDAQNFVLASRIMMITISGQIDDKKLYIDNHLRSVVDFVYSVLKDGVLSLLQHPSKTKVLKLSISNLAYEAGNILSLLEEYFQVNEPEEVLLTKLEYLSIELLFTDIAQSRKSPLIVAVLEGLKLNAAKLLVTIFQRKEDQRQFILHELMSNLEQLLLQKVPSTHFKISNGESVQLIVVVIVRLLQSFDIAPYAAEISSALKEPSAKKLHYPEACDGAVGYIEGIVLCSNEIANTLIAKANNAESSFKPIFTLLIEDLLSMLVLPEWPAAGILLMSLLRAFLYAVQSGNTSTILEPFLLEVGGSIAVKILRLQNSSKTTILLNSETTTGKIGELKLLMDETLRYLSFQSLRSQDFVQAFNILAAKYVVLLKHQIDAVESKSVVHFAVLDSDKERSQRAKEITAFISEAILPLLQAIKDGGVKINQALGSDQTLHSRNAYISVALAEGLSPVYDSFLAVLIETMNSTRVKTKTKAVRVLSSLVDQETELLSTPRIQESISRVLVDSSPSARDAAIDLISKYMLDNSQLIEQFHRPICDKMNDESIQVRKRVVKLTRDMYTHSKRRDVKVHITSCLLKRLDDEESSLAELAKTYLEELWFTSLYGKMRAREQKSVAEAAMQRAEVLMDVVSSGGATARYLQTFLTDFVVLHRGVEIETSIKLITDKTLDFVIDCVDTKFNKDVEKALILISAFVQADPRLMNQDQLVALQPFLIDEGNSGKAVCFYSLKILKSVLPGFKALRPTLVESIQSSLLKRLTKLNVNELHQAMPCLWGLCQMRNNVFKVANATISCMRLLRAYMENSLEQEEEEEAVAGKLKRLLHLLGCFGSYCNFEKYRETFLKSNTGLRDDETVTSLIMKFLLYFASAAKLVDLRVTSINNIMSICTHHPRLFLSDPILGILDREFEGDTMDTKQVIIQGIIGFLNKEDKDVQKRNGAEQKSSQEIKLDVAVFHGNAQSYVNDGVCAGVIQRYFSQVLELCLYDSGDQSLLPTQFLHIVVKLGFVNPKMCISTIFALEASPNRRIKHMAVALHKELFDRHESLTDASYLEGLRLAVDFRKRVTKDFCHDKGFLATVHRIVSASYSAKKKFIQSVCKAFSISIRLGSLDAYVRQRDVVVFTAVNISAMMFSSYEEVLIVIHHLDKALTREGIDLSEMVVKEQAKTVTVETRRKLQYFFISSQTVLAMVILRACLVSAFSISQTQIEEFQPKKANLADRQAPKVVGLYQFPLEDLELGANLTKQEGYGRVFARLLHRIREFTTSSV